jgi:hypothetical protein
MLPEKEYFTLAEIMERWNTPYSQLQHYIEHGLIEVQLWIDGVNTRASLYQEIINAENSINIHHCRFFISHCSFFRGYAVVPSHHCRKIFKSPDGAFIREFKIAGEETYFHSEEDILITEYDLHISRKERDRFEQRYNIPVSCNETCDAAFPQQSIVGSSSFPGRPSIMLAIREELKRRAENDALEDSLQRECLYLEAWAKRIFPGIQVPRKRSIENAIRHEYHKYASMVKYPV